MAFVVSSGQELKPQVFHQVTGSASFAASQTISRLNRPFLALYTSDHCFNAFRLPPLLHGVGCTGPGPAPLTGDRPSQKLVPGTRENVVTCQLLTCGQINFRQKGGFPVPIGTDVPATMPVPVLYWDR